MSHSAENETFERILAAEKDRRTQLRLKLAKGAAGIGDPERALELLNSQDLSEHGEAELFRGLSLEMLESVDAALAAYRAAEALGVIEAQVHVGRILASQGDLAGAEREMRACAQAGHADALASLGALFLEQGDEDRGESTLIEGARNGSAEALSSLLWRLLLNSDLETADAVFSELHDECGVPEFDSFRYGRVMGYEVANALNNYALVAMCRGGDLQVAERAWVDASRSGHVEAATYTWVCDLRRGNREEARSHFASLKGATDQLEPLRHELSLALLEPVHPWLREWWQDAIELLDLALNADEG